VHMALFDHRTGTPVAIEDGAQITALRTARPAVWPHDCWHDQTRAHLDCWATASRRPRTLNRFAPFVILRRYGSRADRRTTHARSLSSMNAP
jgi:hypothetical protein